MLIKKIHIKRFGCFQDFATELQPGLNIIRGPNESGKSTLHQALLMALMAQPTQNQKTTLWRNWDSDCWYELQLELADLNGVIYRISKDFESASQVVYLPNGEIARGRDKVDQTLGAIVGTTSMVIVQSTLCVEQDTLADLASGQKEISHSLETVLTGSQDHIFTNQALKRLDSHIKEFKKGFSRGAAHPGPLTSARDEVERLQKRVQEIRDGVSVHTSDDQELADLEARLKDIEQELRPLKITMEQAARYQVTQRDFKDWQAQEDARERKIQQVESAQNDLNNVQSHLASMGALASLNSHEKQAIDQLVGRVQTLRELGSHQKPEQSIGSESGLLWIIPLVAGVLIAAAGLVLSYLGFSSALGIIGPVVGLLLIIAGMWLRRRSPNPQQMPVELVETVSLPDRMERPLPPTNPLHSAERQLQQALSSLGCATIDELNNRYELVVKLRGQMEKAQALIGTLLSEMTLDELEEQRRDASRRRRDAEEIMKDLSLQRVSNLSPIELNRLESDCQKLEAEQSDLENERQRLSIKLEQHQVSKEDLYQAEEMLEAANRRYAQVQERLAVFELTNEVLSAARETTLQQAQERLGPATGKYLRLLTNQRYETAWIDANLNIQLQDPAQPDRRITPDRLSRGARDQLYMAARLALVDMLFPKTRPPILLDDPFVHFDPTRLAAAIKMCCDIAEERQVILFTCSDSYNHVGHHIVMPAAQLSA